MKNITHSQFNKPSASFFTKLFMFTFVVLIGYAIISQTIFIPHTLASNYDTRLKSNYQLLSVQFTRLSKSTELPVYNDPYSDVQAGKKDLIATLKLLDATEQTLIEYRQEATILPSTKLAPYSLSFKKAELIKSRSEDIFLQSQEVISSYKELINYLLQINTAKTILINTTKDINDLKDLNILIGQGDIVAKRADQLRTTISNLQNVTPPLAYNEFHMAVLASYKQALSGLEQLSAGAKAQNDTQLNAGAKTLEQAISKNDLSDNMIFDTVSANSSVLANTSILADKISSLQPFAEE